jgi:hypothetical protein
MADDVELIIQVPRGSAVEHQLRDDPPRDVASGRVMVERLPADAGGRILPPEAGEVVLSVLSPEALREPERITRVIKAAATDGEPLVVLVEVAEELRDDELTAVLAAADRTHRIVLLRILGST